MGTGGEKRAKAKAKTSRASLVLDGGLLDEYAELEDQLAGLDEGSPEALEVAEQIIAAEQALKAAEVEFVFQFNGRGRWNKMKADHPPSDEEAAAGAEFNLEFPFHAMAACLVSPSTIEINGDVVDLDVEGFERLNDELLDETQFTVLWAACARLYWGGRVTRPESQAARSILSGRNERPSSEQPSEQESPAES